MTLPAPASVMVALDEEALEAAARILGPYWGEASASEYLQESAKQSAAEIVTAYLSSCAERGFRMMPREATAEMLCAALNKTRAEWKWRSMFDAYPTPPDEKVTA